MMQAAVCANELYVMPTLYPKLLSLSSISKPETIEHYYGNDMFTQVKSKMFFGLSEKIKKIRYIPLSKTTIDYESNVWDFSQYTMTASSHTKLHFDIVPKDFVDEMKFFVIAQIMSGNNKFQTIYSRFRNVNHFFRHLEKRKLDTVNAIVYEDVKSFLDGLQCSEYAITHYKAHLRMFLELYSSEYDMPIYTNEIQELCRIEHKPRGTMDNHSKRKPIPSAYYDNLVKVLVNVMNDETENSLIRGKAAILVMASQTGLRASELSLLESNSVESILIDDYKYRLINYTIIKTAKGNNGYIKNTTYINDLSYQAYKVLEEVFKENRKERNSKLLYCPSKPQLPVNSNRFVEMLKFFCVKYYKEIGSTKKEYSDTLSGTCTIKQFNTYFKGYKIPTRETNPDAELSNDTVCYYPVIHQFRNTVVTQLIKNGVNLEYVRRYMGHLSNEMTSGYADYNDTDLQENAKYSEEVLRTYLSGDAKILGPSGNKLMERINEWISENNLNVAENLDEIIDGLLKKVPIRAKHGGMCIKGAKLTNACSVDSKTDEFYCACGVCPNICHFYFMANVSYSDFKASAEIYEYNRDNGFKRQAEKEFSKTKHIINNRLLPELRELENEIKIKGKNNILSKHPELAEIIDNFEEIKTEVAKWNCVRD